MATSTSMVPYSNPAGNNQTNPSLPVSGARGGLSTTQPIVASPVAAPGTAAQANPLIPTGAATTNLPASPGVAQLNAVPSTFGMTQGGTPDTNFYQQLQDIYGATGNEMWNLYNSIGGVNSQTLQDYAKSLQPQFAQSKANLLSSLGAGGVGMNSSVASLGLANLGAQEDAMMAGEQANLLQDQLRMQMNLLGGIAPTAQEQVSDEASSFGNMLGGILGNVGSLIPGVGSILSMMKSFGGSGGGGGAIPSSTPSFNPSGSGADWNKFMPGF